LWNNNNKTDNKMKRLIIILAILLGAITASAQEDDAQKFKGKIGDFDITAVYMSLREIGSVEVGDSIGYYYYTDRPKTKFTLRLKDYDEVMNETSFRVSYHVVLGEYTPKGFNSGTFDGWTSAMSDNLSGTFTNSQGKEYDFWININSD